MSGTFSETVGQIFGQAMAMAEDARLERMNGPLPPPKRSKRAPPRPLTRQQLIRLLQRLADDGMDTEGDHEEADQALLAYIDDKTITALYERVQKWYA